MPNEDEPEDDVATATHEHVNYWLQASLKQHVCALELVHWFWLYPTFVPQVCTMTQQTRFQGQPLVMNSRNVLAAVVVAAQRPNPGQLPNLHGLVLH